MVALAGSVGWFKSCAGKSVASVGLPAIIPRPVAHVGEALDPRGEAGIRSARSGLVLQVAALRGRVEMDGHGGGFPALHHLASEKRVAHDRQRQAPTVASADGRFHAVHQRSGALGQQPQLIDHGVIEANRVADGCASAFRVTRPDAGERRNARSRRPLAMAIISVCSLSSAALPLLMLHTPPSHPDTRSGPTSRASRHTATMADFAFCCARHSRASRCSSASRMRHAELRAHHRMPRERVAEWHAEHRLRPRGERSCRVRHQKAQQRRVRCLTLPTPHRRGLTLSCPLPALALRRRHRPVAYSRSGHYRKVLSRMVHRRSDA